MRQNTKTAAPVEETPLINRRPLLPRRHRRRWIALVTAIVVIAGGGTFYVIGRRATQVSVDAAVARYRNDIAEAPRQAPVDREKAAVDAPSTQTARGPTTAAARDAEPADAPQEAAAVRPENAVPTPGVYVYATKGYEEVSVLGGARHTYPDETTITVKRTACGADIRWDGFEERWDEWTTCADGNAIQWRAFLTYHEFFKQVDRKNYDCTPTSLLRPGSDAVGSAFTGHCEGSGAEINLTGRIVGIENVKVGTTTLRAVRVHIDERPSGATKGRRLYDSWYQIGTNLLVRRDTRTDVDSKSAFGYTHYIERLSLVLSSLEPRR